MAAAVAEALAKAGEAAEQAQAEAVQGAKAEARAAAVEETTSLLLDLIYLGSVRFWVPSCGCCTYCCSWLAAVGWGFCKQHMWDGVLDWCKAWVMLGPLQLQSQMLACLMAGGSCCAAAPEDGCSELQGTSDSGGGACARPTSAAPLACSILQPSAAAVWAKHAAAAPSPLLCCLLMQHMPALATLPQNFDVLLKAPQLVHLAHFERNSALAYAQHFGVPLTGACKGWD